MKRTERIDHYEDILDRGNAAVKALEEPLDAFLAMMPELKKLEKYYAGGQWRRDFEADEAGKLPADLKRGVLSEDGIYDLLAAVDELRRKLKKL